MRSVARTVSILITTATFLPAAGHDRRIPVVACVRPNNSEPSAQVLLRAKSWASQILTGAGVQVIWRDDRREQPIVIDIALDVPESFHRGSLAYAQLFEGTHITIFWNRVQQSPSRDITAALLGHVIAHEIAHILEGTDHHSSAGIMKANWTVHEIEQMNGEPLSFDPVDIDLIQRGLVARRRAIQTGTLVRELLLP
jgi:hypothetical protein